MSAKDYERIWRETNAEAAASSPPYERDRVWNRIFNRKMCEARLAAAKAEGGRE